MANNIKMYVRVVGCDGVNWILLRLARNKLWALANTVMNIRVPYNAGNFLTSCETVSFSRRTPLHEVS